MQSADGPDALLIERCGLRDVETLTLWTLVALCCSAKAVALAQELGVDRTGAVTVAALRELTGQHFADVSSVFSPHGRLRRFALVERSDSGASDVHESRWTWTLSRRVLAFLHGDMSID